jgi:Zn-dependent peptidase ImmA (M78 family)
MSKESKEDNSSPTIYDEHGVPVYNPQDIENKADAFLALFDKERLENAGPTPLGTVAQRLSRDYNIAINLEADLGEAEEGAHKVVGKFIFKPKAILVDRTLQDDTPRFNFTFAHEIGHLVLHRHLKLKKDFDPNEISDTERDLVTGKKRLKTPRDWIEWQANRFGAALLMPRTTFTTAIVHKQQDMGIKRNIGLIYLHNRFHMRDYIIIVDHLQSMYQASKSAVQNRLTDLHLVIDRRHQNTKHISELLRSD